MRLIEQELRYGYTLDDLDHLAHAAVLRARYAIAAGEWAYRFTIAWEAVAEHLYAVDERPRPYDLIGAGMAAVADEYRADRRHHGNSENERAFEVFWADMASVTRSHEGGVVDRLALAQIWPTLSNRQRQVLSALATFGDHRPAADALGMDATLFSVHLSKARREFLRLWHEHEEPSRPWGTDRRHAADSVRRKNPASHVKYRSGRKKADPVHGKASTYRNHKCRCTPCREAAMADQREYKARVAANRAAAKGVAA